MSLSEFIWDNEYSGYGENIPAKNVKEFIQKRNNQLDDFSADIIALIEINNFGKEDLLKKMRRLCKAHKEELNKEAGEKLT